VLNNRGPSQTNGVDCGIHFLSNLEFLTRGAEPTYDHRSVQDFRLQIGSSLLQRTAHPLVPATIYSQPHLTTDEDIFIAEEGAEELLELDDDSMVNIADDTECDWEAVEAGGSTVEDEEWLNNLIASTGIKRLSLPASELPLRNQWTEIKQNNWKFGSNDKRKNRLSRKYNPKASVLIFDGTKTMVYGTCVASKNRYLTRYSCNDCRHLMRSNTRVAINHKILHEVPSAVAILNEGSDGKAYMALPKHIDGCVHSDIPAVQPHIIFSSVPTEAELTSLYRYTVTF
jgi:hypothetical protein